MPTIEDIRSWTGQDVVDSHGEKVGSVDHVYLDRETGEPTFAAVKTGMFGLKSSLVPIDGFSGTGGDLRVSYEKAQIKDAPAIDADQELTPEEEQKLYAHYGRDYQEFSGQDYDAGTTGRETTHGTVGHDTSGPTTDDAMTRSEEELRVGKTEREAGRARLRKYVVTEEVTQTVPVQREEVRIEREPITDGNVDNALDGPAISEEEHEVVLHAEEPVVEKRAVPKERVRLDKETVAEDVTVSDEVRKERIDAEGDVRGDRGL